MPTLAPGQPITTGEPRLLVENPFAPGRYRFQLVVIDDSGLESDPAELIVSVHDIPAQPRPPGPGRVFRPGFDERVRIPPGLAERIRVRRPQ